MTRILYKAAMIIKSDINSSAGFSMQLLDLADLQLKKCKDVVPKAFIGC